LILTIVIISACFVFPAIAADSPAKSSVLESDGSGHMFCFSSFTSDNWFVYECSDADCTARITKSPSEVIKIWNSEYINKAPSDTSVNDSCYLDLNCDGVINARDYALLKQACKNEIPGDDNDIPWGS